MAGTINVTTDQVNQIADRIEGLNKRLSTTVQECAAAINNLKSTWDSEAAQETMVNFTNFSTEFGESYEKTIQAYVTFLRNAVAQGYFETETSNTNLAGAFK